MGALGDHEQVRTGYVPDSQLSGVTVIPSAVENIASGRSYGFDPHSKKVRQNIISMDESGQIKVAELTTEQIVGKRAAPNTTDESTAATPEQIRDMSAHAEQLYKNIGTAAAVGLPAAPPPPVAQPVAQAPQRFDVPSPTKPANEMQEIPEVQVSVDELPEDPSVPPELLKAAESLRALRDVDRAEAAPPEKINETQRQKAKPLVVSIAGPFGRMKMPYSSIFRDGICLVLVTDHRQMPGMFELPEIDTEPLELELTVNNKTVRCIWGGIQFTLPNGSVTFTVLLVQEETDVGEEGLFR